MAFGVSYVPLRFVKWLRALDGCVRLERMSRAIHIRPFEEADRENLRELFLESRRATFTWLDYETFQREDFDSATQGESILVAEVEGKIVGFSAVWEADNFLHSLFLHPDFLRQGIGSVLLAACMKDLGRPARLKCLCRNEKAIAFYQSHGWNIAERGSDPLGDYFVMRLET